MLTINSLAAGPLGDVLEIVPRCFEDERGFFSETYNRARLAEAGLIQDFVQDNHSLSRRQGTVRGLHFQAPPAAQAKLVRVTSGAIFDVAVDIRRGSPSYGRHVSAIVSARKVEPDSGAGGFRPWLLHARARHRGHLQGRRAVRLRTRSRPALERSAPSPSPGLSRRPAPYCRRKMWLTRCSRSFRPTSTMLRGPDNGLPMFSESVG